MMRPLSYAITTRFLKRSVWAWQGKNLPPSPPKTTYKNRKNPPIPQKNCLSTRCDSCTRKFSLSKICRSGSTIESLPNGRLGGG